MGIKEIESNEVIYEVFYDYEPSNGDPKNPEYEPYFAVRRVYKKNYDKDLINDLSPETLQEIEDKTWEAISQ